MYLSGWLIAAVPYQQSAQINQMLSLIPFYMIKKRTTCHFSVNKNRFVKGGDF